MDGIQDTSPHVYETPDGVTHTVVGEIAPEREKPLVILILEDSERAEQGLIKDCHGTIPVGDKFDGDVVGVWDKFGEGTFYCSLTTTIDARQDSLIKHFEEVVKERHELWDKIGKPKPISQRLERDFGTHTFTPIGPLLDEFPIVEKQPTKPSLADLRARLKGG